MSGFWSKMIDYDVTNENMKNTHSAQGLKWAFFISFSK